MLTSRVEVGVDKDSWYCPSLSTLSTPSPRTSLREFERGMLSRPSKPLWYLLLFNRRKRLLSLDLFPLFSEPRSVWGYYTSAQTQSLIVFAQAGFLDSNEFLARLPVFLRRFVGSSFSLLLRSGNHNSLFSVWLQQLLLVAGQKRIPNCRILENDSHPPPVSLNFGVWSQIHDVIEWYKRYLVWHFTPRQTAAVKSWNCYQHHLCHRHSWHSETICCFVMFEIYWFRRWWVQWIIIIMVGHCPQMKLRSLNMLKLIQKSWEL